MATLAMSLPLSFNLAGRRCLLIGSGELAIRKARLLSKADAVIDLLVPLAGAEIVASGTGSAVSASSLSRLPEELLSLIEFSGGEVSAQQHAELPKALSRMLQGRTLCVVADDHASIDYEQLAATCEQHNCPVNVVDQPSLCTFSFPSIVDRSPVSIAIASAGSAPVLARQLREKLEAQMPAALGELAELASTYRPLVAAEVTDAAKRRYLWEEFFSGPVAEHVYAGRTAQARRVADQLLARFSQAGEKSAGDAQQPTANQENNGEVYLVGAGPGDPELLTLRALRLMQQADIVFYDRLVADSILERVRRDAERVYVGKQRANHSVAQPRINQLLLEEAQKGKRVLRLKGGDPFIFGRGGEELEHLSAAGIDFQVVPGVTAASGCASYAGIPLTHRDHAQSVRFVTGHLKSGELDLPWLEFLQPQQTLVFYMGLVGLPVISEKMIAAGRDPATPVALIQQGTTSEQRVLIASLQSMPELVLAEQVRAPTITIVGDVVSLHQKLKWFETKK